MSAGTDDDDVGTREDAAPDAQSGTWRTYRYRFGGAAITAEATGTMKALSFRSAARRILARGLADMIGPEPAYLRLRAAGEEEVLLRVVRTHAGTSEALRLEIVPDETYRFAAPRGPADIDGRDRPPTVEKGSPPMVPLATAPPVARAQVAHYRRGDRQT